MPGNISEDTTLTIHGGGKKKKIPPQYCKIDIEEQCTLYASLTLREKQLLTFLSHGTNYRTIAFIFQSSINNIKFHRKNLYSKMQFKDQRDLKKWSEQYFLIFFSASDLAMRYDKEKLITFLRNYTQEER